MSVLVTGATVVNSMLLGVAAGIIRDINTGVHRLVWLLAALSSSPIQLLALLQRPYGRRPMRYHRFAPWYWIMSALAAQNQKPVPIPEVAILAGRKA